MTDHPTRQPALDDEELPEHLDDLDAAEAEAQQRDVPRSGPLRFGRMTGSSIVPEGGTPLVGFDLTTHQGHFVGSGHNRLLLYTMPWHLDRAYRIAGREAQHAFWGQGEVTRLSMPHQLALAIADVPA